MLDRQMAYVNSIWKCNASFENEKKKKKPKGLSGTKIEFLNWFLYELEIYNVKKRGCKTERENGVIRVKEIKERKF